MDGPSPSKRRKIGDEAREIIAKVYHFLKAEYEFTDLHREPNVDISHLRNITQRTAQATGVSERSVYKILHEEREKLKAAGSSQSTEQISLTGDISEESGVTAAVNEGTEPEDRKIVATTSKEIEQILIKQEDVPDEKNIALGVSGRIERILVIKKEEDTSGELAQKVIKEERSSEERVLPPLTEEKHMKEERSTSEDSDIPPLTEDTDIKEERSTSDESDIPPLTEETYIKEEGSTSDESDIPPLTEEIDIEIKEERDLSEEGDLPPSTEDVSKETGTSEESTTSEDKETSESSNTSGVRETSEESNTSEDSKTSSEESPVHANGESEGLGINGIKGENDTREESSGIRRRRYSDWS